MAYLSPLNISIWENRWYRLLAMSKGDLSIIDTNNWKPVQSPGLKAPRHQLSYDSAEIQHVLAESFGAMFPSIVAEKNGLKRYSFLNKQGVDQFAKLKPAKNIGDIPRAEMLRLMEGWIRLRRKLQEEEVPSKVGSILLNFRVPNPRESLDRYMLYKVGDEERLVIRWGFETKDDRAVSLERAISILMDVPLGHMRSILSTTMTATTSTVPVGQMLSSVSAGEGGKPSAKLQRKTAVGLAIAVSSTLVLGGLLISKEMQDEEVVAVASGQVFEEKVDVVPEVVVEPVELAEKPLIEEPVVVNSVAQVKAAEAKPEVVEVPVNIAQMEATSKDSETNSTASLLDDLVVSDSMVDVGADESEFSLDTMVIKDNDKSNLLDDMVQ